MALSVKTYSVTAVSSVRQVLSSAAGRSVEVLGIAGLRLAVSWSLDVFRFTAASGFVPKDAKRKENNQRNCQMQPKVNFRGESTNHCGPRAEKMVAKVREAADHRIVDDRSPRSAKKTALLRTRRLILEKGKRSRVDQVCPQHPGQSTKPYSCPSKSIPFSRPSANPPSHMKAGIDSYSYHRFFSEIYLNQKPAANPIPSAPSWTAQKNWDAWRQAGRFFNIECQPILKLKVACGTGWERRIGVNDERRVGDRLWLCSPFGSLPRTFVRSSTLPRLSPSDA